MKFKNKKVMAGMRAVAVISIISTTLFSSSYGIVLANEYSTQDSIVNHEYTHDNDSYNGSDFQYSDESKDDSHSEYSDSFEHDSYNHDDSDDSYHNSSDDNDDMDHSKNDNDHGKDHDKITICHATHSDSNPYVEITISISGKDAHKHHQDKEDIIPAPKDGCPKGHDNHENHDGDDNHGGNDGDHDGDDNDNDGGHHEDQNTAPVISLLGESTIYVYQGQTYTDQGATANDKEDGDITSHIISVSNVDTSNVGTYTVTYNVKDSKGLCASTVTRTVIVKPASNANNAPVITLIGLNPIVVTQGDIYLDPGATANDIEDGDITSSIVKTGSVDINVVGTYTITYNVTDSKGLSATTVTRTVNVVPKETTSKGKITFCLVVGNENNEVATSSYALPDGTFTMSLGTTTDFTNSVLFTKTWNASSFAPNQKVILGQNDSDCVSYGDLEFGTYNYSEMSVNGSTWNVSRYNDQNSQPVNNVFDFFPFDVINDNSDGVIIINSERPERTVYVYNTYKAGPSCDLPEITSDLASSVKVNQNFTLALNASSTSSVNWNVATTSLPVGLSFATSTNTISGIPTVAGTYSVWLTATNSCGYTDKTLVITVTGDTTGGGSKNANLSVIKTANRSTANTNDQIEYTISLENKGPDAATNVKISDVLPSQVDFVSASSSVGSYATSTGVWTVGDFANGSTTTLVIVTKVKTGTEGQNIANTATVTSDISDSDSSNNSSTSNVGVINPNTNPAGGGGGGSTGGSGGGSNGPIVGSYGGGSTGSVLSAGIANLPQVQGCNYLLDYLRRDFNNNPYEVTKLQLFLINLEGFTNLKVTGIYDQATIDAVNVFQMRYKDDVLTPWGHTAPTSYTYILTKKKVNEIYCKIAFPVTADQQLEIDNYRNTHTNTVNTNVNVRPVTNNEVGYGSNTTNVSKSNSFNSIGYVKNSTTTATTSKIAKVATTVNDVTGNVANVGMTTLAGFSSSTKGLANDFVANIISSGKKIGSLLGALFSLPLSLTSKVNQNSCQNNLGIFSGLNLILIILIAVISYFWYREYRNNKKIEEINKEIDLQ
jgi:uncharacterized repeat protein (TIGR01451 family)